MINPLYLYNTRKDKELINTGNSIIWEGTLPLGEEDKKVAIKIAASDEGLGQLNNEIKAFKQLFHPHIIRFYGDCLLSSKPTIILELMEYSLHHVITKTDMLTDTPANPNPIAREKHLNIAFGLACGLQHLHEKAIVHRDIKTENILLNKECTEIKICDLGLAMDLKNMPANSNWSVGTPNWVSPEAVAAGTTGKKPTDFFKIDIWGFGQAILQFYDNTAAPYYADIRAGESTDFIMRKILKGEHDPVPVGKPLTFLIEKCLNKNPALRPYATDVVDALTRLKNKQ